MSREMLAYIPAGEMDMIETSVLISTPLQIVGIVLPRID